MPPNFQRNGAETLLLSAMRWHPKTSGKNRQKNGGERGKTKMNKSNTNREKREKILQKLISLHGKVCWYCGLDITYDEKHIDHIIPKSVGGANDISNYALTCKFCNHAKYDGMLGEFLDWLYWVKKQRQFPAVDEFE